MSEGRGSFLEMPPVEESTTDCGAVFRSCDYDDVREMREKYEAEIERLKKKVVDFQLGCARADGDLEKIACHLGLDTDFANAAHIISAIDETTKELVGRALRVETELAERRKSDEDVRRLISFAQDQDCCLSECDRTLAASWLKKEGE